MSFKLGDKVRFPNYLIKKQGRIGMGVGIDNPTHYTHYEYAHNHDKWREGIVTGVRTVMNCKYHRDGDMICVFDSQSPFKVYLVTVDLVTNPFKVLEEDLFQF